MNDTFINKTLAILKKRLNNNNRKKKIKRNCRHIQQPAEQEVEEEYSQLLLHCTQIQGISCCHISNPTQTSHAYIIPSVPYQNRQRTNQPAIQSASQPASTLLSACPPACLCPQSRSKLTALHARYSYTTRNHIHIHFGINGEQEDWSGNFCVFSVLPDFS